MTTRSTALFRRAAACGFAFVALSAFAQVAAPAAKSETIVLPTFTVSTEQDVGYRATNSVSATRVDTPIKDLPFAISAFTGQFIEDIGALELLDIVSFAPGVTSGAKEFTQGNNRYSIRGFDGDVTPQRNGFSGGRYVDSANIERVEVVKGPASLLYGQITPGGTVNYITKRATNKNFVKIKQQVGTDSFWRTDVDINRVLVDGRVNGRLIASYENSLAWANPSAGHSGVVAGSFDVKLHDNVSLILDFETFHKVQNPLISMSPNLAVPITATSGNFARLADRARAQAYIDAGNLNLGFIGYPPLPRDFNYPGDGDYRTSDFNNFNAELNVKLGTNWRARANFGWDDYKLSNKLTGLAEFTTNPTAAYLATKNRFDYVAELAANPAAVLADPTKTASSLLTRRKRLEESGGDTRTYQAEISGLVDIGGIKVKPLFGVLLSQIGTNGFRRASNTTPPATTPNASTTPGQHFQPWDYNNPSTWDHTPTYNTADIPNIEVFNNTHGEESAAYALLNASFFKDRLILIGGARYNKTWTIGTNFLPTVATTPGPATVGSKYEESATTPQFGVGFKVRRDMLLFANYSESFFIEERSLTAWNPAYNPSLPSGAGNPVTVSTPAKPTTGSGYEVGVKTDFLEGRVSSTVSLFHLERVDRVLRFRQTAPDGTFPTLNSQGTVDQSEGVEVELTWSPMNNWQVYASYTGMDIKTTKAEFATNPVYSGAPLTDLATQAAYLAAYNEAKALILGAVPEGSAEHLASLWSRYSFVDGPLKDWWIGAGFVYTGDKAQRSANPTLFLDSNIIYDMTVGRDWKIGKQKWSGTLAVKNLADTQYWNANQSRGTPRRFILTVSTKF
jgi:iron complex outermembrane recepter protein